MKKWMTTFVGIILLFTRLGFTAFAAPASATLSDDYQTLTINGNTYSRFDISQAETRYQELPLDIALSDAQARSVKEIFLETNSGENLIYANINFKDGSSLSIGFLRDDYKDEYQKIIAGESNQYLIDFQYPEGNKITASKKDFYGKPALLNFDQLQYADSFPVYATTADDAISVYKGMLLVIEEEYYYVDFTEQRINNPYDFNPYNYKELATYKIGNAELIERMEESIDRYYSEEFGILFDEEFGETISAIFLILVFGIVPFIIFLVFLFLAIRSKTVYKKMFRIVYLLCGLELVVFAIMTVLITMNR